jgi:WXXGXW repeat (2 copies)
MVLMKLFRFLITCLFAAMLILAACPAFAQVSISVTIAPPPLQVDTQSSCPDDGYIWIPGYWAYANDTYYWVPGQWIQPPQVGWYWTPPYWGWDGGDYVFYPGYWGPTVGYYGGINYGYGYGGHGYNGGRWEEGHFSYNTAVNKVSSVHVHSTYVDRSAVNTHATRVSYNGGSGGIQTQPTAKEREESNEHRPKTTSMQPQTQQSEHPQEQPQAKQPEHPQEQQPQAKQPEHPQEQPQAQAQPKPESHQAQQAQPQTHDQSAAPPGAKPGNGPNNDQNH